MESMFVSLLESNKSLLLKREKDTALPDRAFFFTITICAGIFRFDSGFQIINDFIQVFLDGNGERSYLIGRRQKIWNHDGLKTACVG